MTHPTFTLPARLAFALTALLFSAGAVQAQDAAAGQKKAQMCIGCHGIPGYQASFPEVHKVPMIAGQNAQYIGAALAAYKKGDRKHPTMRAIAISLSDQDMLDLSAFYAGLGSQEQKDVPDVPTVPNTAVAALLAKGACISCHGANFNKPLDGTYPKIAGQPADYLYVALKAYSIESNPQIGRANPVMSAQVKQFKLSELKAMAKYIGSLPGEVRTVPESRFR